MAEPEEQLRAAFESHENLAPDLGAVYAGTQELYSRYRRRRRTAQVAGAAVLTGGVLAVGTHLPAGLLPGASPPAPGIGVGAPTVPQTVPTALSTTELERDLDAFDNAGYGYQDAVTLAAIWHTKVDVGYVKAEAGSLLLAGQALPISPHPDPVDSSTPDPGANAALDAFARAGYTYDDAVRLARLWKLADPSDAKVAGGRKLEAGHTLPFPPR